MGLSIPQQKSLPAMRFLLGVAVFIGVLVSVALQPGCIAPVKVTVPAQVGSGEISLRGSRPPEVNGWFDVRSVNQRDLIRRFGTEDQHVVRLAAGANLLDIRVNEGMSEEARLDGWPVTLGGGRSYVLKGEVKDYTALVWIEDEATGERVTPEVSLAIISH